MLASLAGTIANMGGDILALGTFADKEPDRGLLTLKVRGVERQAVLEALKPLGIEVLDVREA
jgi:uncharacterized protein with ACT and thioredoxin-like domain